ncbi:MAG: hypothetical protein AAGI17_03940 [Planctomycetota bacterium]
MGIRAHISAAAMVAAASLTFGQTSQIRFGFTSLPVELQEGQLGLELGTDAMSPFGFQPVGTVTQTLFDSNGDFLSTSNPLLFGPSAFDPLGPGVTFDLTIDNNGVVTGTLFIADADGDVISGDFTGTLPFGPGNLTLIDATFDSFDFVSSGDGTNDLTFDGPDGNSFFAADLIAADPADIGTLQITTSFFGGGEGFSLVQGTFFTVPAPTTAGFAAVGLGLIARRRR